MAQPRISAAELKKLMDSTDAPLILDVRSPNSYDASDKKIPGALRIGLDELEGRLNELDRARQIVAYCTWTNEHSSARAAAILSHNGFTRVAALLDGFDGWVRAGYPVEKK